MDYNYRPDTNHKLLIMPDWAWQVDMSQKYGLSMDGGLSEDQKTFEIHATYNPRNCPKYSQDFSAKVEGEKGVLKAIDKIEKNICQWISTLPMWCQFTAHLILKAETVRSLYMPMEDIMAIEWIQWIEDNADIYELRQIARNTKNSDDMDAKFILEYMISYGFVPPPSDSWGTTRSMCRWLQMKHLNKAVA